MILSIHEAIKGRSDDLWIVFFMVEGERWAQTRTVPTTENPNFCPGGMWCKDFGCEKGINVFTTAEPVVLGDQDVENLPWDEL